MSWSSRWSPLRIIIFILLKYGTMQPTLTMEETFFSRLIVAASHTALSGDLEVFILNLGEPSTTTAIPRIETTTEEEADIIMEQEEGELDNEEYDSWVPPKPESDPFVLRVMRLDGFTSELVGEVTVETPMIQAGNVSLTVPCGFFSRGGAYSLVLQRSSVPPSLKFTDFNNLQVRTTLDVRWPTPSLTLEPQHFNTYPDQPVLATLEYTGISCAPAEGLPVDTYSLQLIYCGASVLSCDPRNRSIPQMLYSEEIKGFPVQKILYMRCEFFGLAGHYALRLKPADGNSTAPMISAYIKVEISNQYVFNVHARSVYPCDGNSGGLSVLFEYPSCRLQEDRVRVYGRLRADVASLAPPSTLHYVAELKAPPGKHTLTFDCEIFTEKFVEYCFIYVSQAINNAMAEVRVDCIPTFPVQDSDAGGWGQWSPWSPCSTTCVGGVRNRYRFCDNPPPRYGAKFCQGNAVETEPCGGSSVLNLNSNLTPSDWECNHGKGLAVERPEITAEIGTKCRCGCVVNLRNETERRILAASTRACPGRSFWLIQAEPEYTIKLHFDQTKFPCPEQYVRARDGDSLSAELLADIALDKSPSESGTIISSEERLLLEFFSDEIVVARPSCVGGFLAHASIFLKPQMENGTADATAVLIGPKVMAAAGRWAMWLSPAHLAAASLLLLMFLVSIFLALQYAVKYRKYQVAEDLDSLTDNSTCSGSMQGLARRARAISSATLISEVVSLVRLSRRGSSGHGRLEEATGDLEDSYESTETQAEVEEAQIVESIIQKQKDSDESGSQKTIVPSTPSRRSSVSSTTTIGQPEIKFARPVKLRTVGPISPVSEEASSSENDRRCSTTSCSNSANNVSLPQEKPSILQFKGFSPASTSSNISTLRCGKETKDRRNRERLLQGPGSEFSLANPDTDLELDYYDYNVVNAGAAPGSYLGMDPAFLVWIPPLTPGESELLEDHHYEEIPDRILTLDTEGTSLSPGEYKTIKYDQNSSSLTPRRLDPGESRLHDEIISEYRARLSEGILPIHRILEESRVRISEESLSRHSDKGDNNPQIDIIPNRLKDSDYKERINSCEDLERPKSATMYRNRFSEDERRTPAAIRHRLQEYVDNSESNSPEMTSVMKKSPELAKFSRNSMSKKSNLRREFSRDSDRDICEVKEEFILPKTPSYQRRYKDIADFNAIAEERSNESIPMKEMGRRCESPARVHRSKESKNIYILKEKEVQSPDYGVEVDMKGTRESFYDFIGEDEDGIKFADDDDEEEGYVDNKVVV